MQMIRTIEADRRLTSAIYQVILFGANWLIAIGDIFVARESLHILVSKTLEAMQTNTCLGNNLAIYGVKCYIHQNLLTLKILKRK